MAEDVIERIRRCILSGDLTGALVEIDDFGFAVSGDVVDEMEAREAWLSKRRRRAIPPEVRGFVCDRDDWTCKICGKDVVESEAHIDHIVPVHLGGDEGSDNLRLTHAGCNLRRTYSEFAWMKEPAA